MPGPTFLAYTDNPSEFDPASQIDGGWSSVKFDKTDFNAYVWN
jgi:hypothetical protein